MELEDSLVFLHRNRVCKTWSVLMEHLLMEEAEGREGGREAEAEAVSPQFGVETFSQLEIEPQDGWGEDILRFVHECDFLRHELLFE